jgi:hypothetical protein
MRKYIAMVAVGTYLAVLAAFVWGAEVKYGPAMAAKFVAGGLVFLWILVRAVRASRFILFGGRVPAIIGRSIVQPPRSSSRPPPP